MDFLTLRKKVIEKDFGGMNDRQLSAVTKAKGPLLILAGAGSGKTTVLVNRIACLLKYGEAYESDKIYNISEKDTELLMGYLEDKNDLVNPEVLSVNPPRAFEILAITFTNKAAGELKDRIQNKLGELSEGIWAGTFHSVCGKILRMNAEYIGYTSHFTVYDTDDQKRLLKQIMKNRGIEEKMYPVRSVLSEISHAKDSLITPKEYETTYQNDLRRKTVALLYRDYQKALKENDAMDFDDMIVNTVLLLEKNPDVLSYYGNKFKYIMVDEYQDTNHAQYRLVSLLASVYENICVVGDDDQSIYRFRGATIENILSFEDEYKNATVIRLEQNYRSVGNILNAANAVIKNNKGRKGKNLWTNAGDGEKIIVHTCLDERSEARYVADCILDNVRLGAKYSDHAILYRMNAQSASMENVFARSGISYRIIGGMRFYERKEIRDVLAYLNVINNKNDAVRLRRIINEPKRGIGETTVQKSAEISEQIGIPLFEVFKNASQYASLQRAANKLYEFCSIIDELSERAETLSIGDLTEEMLEKTGYLSSLMTDTTPEGPDRLENVKEFVSTVRLFEEESPEASLSDFLEEIALVSDTDSLDENEDKVVLMTVHSAKGLEFERVFLIGMEEGIFPGNQSIYGGESEIEEERRLAYVAITRAKRHLAITNASTRMLYGQTGRNLPSRFLKEVPESLCTKTSDTPYFYKEPQKVPTVQSRPTYTPSYKPASAKNDTVYTAGQTVSHKTFGNGLILKVTPMSNDTLLEIAFDTVGTKKLMANFAKLTVIS